MARWGDFDFSQVKRLQKQLNQLQGKEIEKFIEDCSRELAERLLTNVIKRTPIDEYYESGKTAGTLRKGWTSKTQAEAKAGGNPSNPKAYARSLPIRRTGNLYEIEITNPVSYASNVEFGHSIKPQGWVSGKFMLTISEQELHAQAPKVLENKIKKYLEECFYAK